MSDLLTNSKELKTLENQLVKIYGESYYPISIPKKREPLEFVSTDCFSLDAVLGSGIVKGRILEINGPESSYKSTIGYHCIAAYQRKGLICALIDTENAFNPEYATALGVDVDKLMLLQQCMHAEDYLEALRLLAKSPVVDLIVFDSVTSITPKRIAEGDVGDATMALMARLWSTHLPEIVPYLGKNKSTLLVINQLRNTLAMYGPSKSSTGGNALKYYNSVKVEVSKKDVIKEKGKEIGVKVQLKNVKTKVGKPFVTKIISIFFPQFPGDKAGIDTLSDIVDTALDEGVITQGGAMYSWREFPEAKDGNRKLKGKEAVYEFFKQNTNLLDLLKEDLLNNTNHDTTSTDQEDFSEEDYSEEAA